MAVIGELESFQISWHFAQGSEAPGEDWEFDEQPAFQVFGERSYCGYQTA